MCEENRKLNPELNEAALEGVSGGVGGVGGVNGVNGGVIVNYSQEALDKATLFCSYCKRDFPTGCNGGSPELLAQCIGTVEEYYLCPYYSGPVG